MIFYLIIFVIGGLAGWVIDTANRSWCEKKYAPKTLVPGFSVIYGFAAAMLYVLFSLPLSVFWQIVIGAVFATILELISGLLALIFLKRRFWDYRSSRFNFYGLIDAEHAFYWLILVGLYRAVYWFLF